MRQRLSSEPDRYRGRRRVPTPPRSRYAVVMTTAVVGAGVVALGASAMPDAKTLSPAALADLENSVALSDQALEIDDQALDLDSQISERAEDAERASRDADRTPATSMTQAAPDVWMLPLRGYTFTSPYGMRWGKLHAGVDLAAAEGTPFHSIHAGTVTLAGWNGGYGYCVIVKHDDGTEAVYGHASRLRVTAGQRVEAGDLLGDVGNTGHSYGAHLHLEVHVDSEPQDPITWLRGKGVDLKLQVEAIYGGVVEP
ncbi:MULTISPECIES: M23 family metallopeptidase [unclassified Solwaraspora]|uniref:M23 family metallopeptidase n=1 Tax=unclassified Solwaraspora TaxID=2627926 RepID=UPI00248B3C86|nr:MULTISPECIES: M23 family metallopeptidase [unclassified Solwaraspora]WBB96255.1 M23 family metallopeptidase [Solwaraspora sp. WMMA2059]WBC19843.1 M23 family metallopeptidase [Solwaraspora sp. WMMA2080]WFE23446.1 M23 family metallopeptidase [Solwaraspora sp. WMMD937]WJK32565.1 M23 family metallopeptidase [Solwaraspora sp. WMMA2065]